MKRITKLLIVLLLGTAVPVWGMIPGLTALKIITVIVLSVGYLAVLLRAGGKPPADSKRLRRIKRGTDLIWIGGTAAALEAIFLVFWFVKSGAGAVARVFAIVMPVLLIGLVLFSGVIRTASSAKQIKLKDHILMLMLWWVPVVDFFLIRKFYKTAKREYFFELDKLELDSARAEDTVCATKYPILLVHGIFFRDWQLVNYWGRIPAALIRNGAKIFYGKQQSAQSVPDSARELRDTIMNVLQETGAEKVNIIAHSKGGLDSRYAISCLGMDKYVATLTTINTPHKGCDMVDYLLGKLPQGFVDFVTKRYNKIFTVLGDTAPDFISGVKDLSAVRARDYVTEMPDREGVSYRSYMSVMSSAGSAGIPLNFGYLLIKKLNGPNDGLVWEESAKHGSYQLITTPQKRGVSHGDVIDLMRENIEGYDVREFYVGLVSRLREEGC
ncbi:MAG: triacylglycerol lipase [Ruminococcus sp.]|nr:triacylglycerol lipase [Ruminococcus sp.]